MILNPSVGGGSGGGLPKGIICAWSGAQDAIPAGWVLCDGDNGTPDLRGRFVLGAGGNYAVGASGGEETHKLTVQEMPSHSHSFTVPLVSYFSGSSKATGLETRYLNNQSSYTKDNPYSGTTATSGSGSAHNNMPPYYALAWIMKT